jgi:hypothetical protein
MNLTPKQRNFFLFCGGLAVLYLVAREVDGYRRQAEYFRQQAIRAQQQRARAEAQVKAREQEAKKAAAKAAEVSAKASGPVLSAKLAGVWHGRSAMEGLGLCDLRLELALKDDAPEGVTGYSRFSCLPIPSLMARGDRAKAKPALLSRLSPDAAVLSGRVGEDGSVRFEAQKNIGADIHGCVVSSFTLTPFGAGQLAAEWKEPGCADGRMILEKTSPRGGRP